MLLCAQETVTTKFRPHHVLRFFFVCYQPMTTSSISDSEQRATLFHPMPIPCNRTEPDLFHDNPSYLLWQTIRWLTEVLANGAGMSTDSVRSIVNYMFHPRDFAKRKNLCYIMIPYTRWALTTFTFFWSDLVLSICKWQQDELVDEPIDRCEGSASVLNYTSNAVIEGASEEADDDEEDRQLRRRAELLTKCLRAILADESMAVIRRALFDDLLNASSRLTNQVDRFKMLLHSRGKRYIPTFKPVNSFFLSFLKDLAYTTIEDDSSPVFDASSRRAIVKKSLRLHVPYGKKGPLTLEDVEIRVIKEIIEIMECSRNRPSQSPIIKSRSSLPSQGDQSQPKNNNIGALINHGNACAVASARASYASVTRGIGYSQ